MHGSASRLAATVVSVSLLLCAAPRRGLSGTKAEETLLGPRGTGRANPTERASRPLWGRGVIGTCATPKTLRSPR
jgi:hypothetical protein